MSSHNYPIDFDNTQEVWKDVVGYEGLYQVSNLGNVRSLYANKYTMLKGDLNNAGYRRVTLIKASKKARFFIHKLVAIVFLNYVPNKSKRYVVINHIDGNRINNKLENLEIVSQIDNIRKAEKPKQKHKSSIFYGVSKYKDKWRVVVCGHYFGDYETEKIASTLSFHLYNFIHKRFPEEFIQTNEQPD